MRPTLNALETYHQGTFLGYNKNAPRKLGSKQLEEFWIQPHW